MEPKQSADSMERIRMETILDLAYWSKIELKLLLLANRALEKV